MSLKRYGLLFATIALILSTVMLASPLSISLNKSQYEPGEVVKVTIQGKPNTVYGMDIWGPNNFLLCARQISTDSSGKGSQSCGIPQNAPEGKYEVTVSGGGEQASKTFTVKKAVAPPPPPPKKKSSIELNINATVLELGQVLHVTGDLTPDIEGARIILTYISPSGNVTRVYIDTGPRGVFEDFFQPEELGRWTVEAKWLGNAEYKGSSKVKEFWVKQRLEVSLTAYPTKAPLNSNIVLSGSIEPALANVKVVLQYSLDGSAWQKVSETTTGVDGSFGFTFTATVSGVIKFRAVVPETDTLLESISNVVEVNVVEALKASMKVEVEPQELMLGEKVLIKVSFNVSVTGRATVSAYYRTEEIPIAELELEEARGFEYEWTPEKGGVYVIMVKIVPEYGSPLIAFSMVNVRIPFFTFTLTLKTEEGVEVEGVFVKVYSNGELVAYGQSGPNGRISFTLKSGVYKLIFVYMGREIKEAEYEVKTDLEEEVTLPLVALEFEVKDALGNPLAGVPISAVDEYGVKYAAITDTEGKARLIVPKGKLKVVSGGVEKEISAEKRQTIELTLRTGFGIEHLALSLAIGVAIGVAVGAAVMRYMGRRRTSK